MAYTNPCANGCDYDLPIKDTDNDCELFNDNLIDQLRFGYFGKPLVTPLPTTGGTQPQITARSAEWASRLDNTSLKSEAPDAIRFVDVPNFVMPAADAATKTTASGKIIGAAFTPREITGVIDDDSDQTYAFWSKFTECPKTVLLWFNSGGHTYGGQTGLEATVLASYRITTDGVSHAWTIRVTFNQRGALARNTLLV